MAEVLRPDLADPLVVLVLVVDERDQQMLGDDGHLRGGDGADAGVDAFGDGVPERAEALDGGQGAAELLRVR
ncbi:hypothetical protein [Streptomyces acidiscabies]|uniref:Uncharacterized protein n=1 Tax=Streptomyces acidiscabies TaxID=42234 RepID=A0AAP6BKL7_9ACTN|nr:hypothetical protein [Streptomyces acidiscabies]MBZ3918079.1 hypothetical protein [Streptomyces acidiscabies]MDX2966521.1 hypothetical protein [Streptomyces acidiscabies]MDX3021937.1 hypothetical protein [Streptomyces acidiscabies]MDX3789594.1 hypothetical protein [Streptomyces acidiscabies]